MPFDFNTPKKGSSNSAQEGSPWTVPGTSDTSPPPSSQTHMGFQNPPQVKRPDSYPPDHDDRRSYAPITRPSSYRRPNVHRNVELPWHIILPVFGVILIIAFLYVFRNEITAFLSTVLSWIIVLIIIVVVLRSVLGIGRR